MTIVSGFDAKNNIIIDHSKIGAVLSDYPVMVKLDTNNFDFSSVNTDGYDIVFADLDDNLLDFEMEYFNKTEEKAVFHVRVPSVSATVDTVIRMHYGKVGATDQSNKIGVWDPTYEAVWHMDSALEDSTTNTHDGVSTGTTLVDGLNGKGRNFAGGTDRIDFDDVDADNIFNVNAAHTITVLFKPDTLSNNGALVWMPHWMGGTQYQYFLTFGDGLNNDDLSQRMNASGWGTKGRILDVPTGEYTLAHFSRDASNWYGTKNGVKGTTYANGTVSSGTENTNDVLRIGNSNGLDRGFDGIIDEVRIARSALSEEWNTADDYNLRLNTLVSIEEYVEGYAASADITIDSTLVDETLVDYPVRVILTDTDIAFTSVLSANGYDIVFADLDDSLLDFEIVSFDATNKKAVFDVRIPSVSSTVDTQFKVHYGKSGATDLSNKTGVWNSNYAAVYHLGYGLTDSTIHGTTATNVGTTVVDGLHTKGRNFSGSAQYLTINDIWDEFPTADADFTIQALAKSGDYNSQRELVDIGDGSTKKGFRLLTYQYDVYAQIMDGVNRYTAINADGLSNSEYYLFCSSYNGTDHISSHDNDHQTETTGSWIRDTGLNASIGRQADGDNYWSGVMDEVRISMVALSAAWKKADVANLKTGTLVSIDNTLDLNDYDYYRELTVDNTKVDDTLPNYPVRVKLTAANFDFTKVLATGIDIVFTDASDNLLDYEMELFDDTNEKAIFHVRVPSVSSSADTTIKMYYGNTSALNHSNKTGVWDSGYLAVYHLSDTKDSTINGYDLSTGGAPTAVDGLHGDAYSFDGSDDLFYNTAIAPSAYPVTIQSLNYHNESYSEQNIVAIADPANTAKLIGIGTPSTTSVRQFHANGSWATVNQKTVSEGYLLVSAVFNTNDFNLFVDTDSPVQNTGSYTLPTSLGRLGLGYYPDGTPTEKPGKLEEVRISSSARSAAWLKADAYNLKLDTLLSVGTEQSNGGEPPAAAARRIMIFF